MLIPFNPYSLWLFGVALLLFWVTIIVWQRSAVAHEPLGLTLTAGGWWALLYGLELTAQEDAIKLFWFCLKHIGIVTITPWWVLFVLEYTGSSLHRSRRVIFGLTWLSFLSFILIWTNQWHHLFYSALPVVEMDGVSAVQSVKGPFFAVHIAVTYSLLFLSGIYFLRHIGHTSGNSVRQRRFLLLALVIPWGANALHLLNLDPLPLLDFGPFALAISGLSVTWVLFDMQIMDLIPVNATLLFDAVSDGMILVDPRQKILAINPTARKMLGDSMEHAVGQPLAHLIPGVAHLSLGSPPDPTERIEFQWQERFFELRRMQLTFRFRHPNGQLWVLNDVTLRKQSELEREGLIQQLQNSLGQSRALYRSSRAVIGLEDLPTQLQSVTDEIFVALEVTQVVMVLAEREGREVTLIVQARPQELNHWQAYDDLLEYPLIARALTTAQLAVRQRPDSKGKEETMLAVAPLRYRSEKMGALIVYDENLHRTLSQQEGQLLMAMAGHAAIAISNNHLFEEVHHLATTDGLTKLYNRRHFLALAEQAFQYAKPRHEPLTVLLLDVDLFKQINDRHGHTTGDEVLRGIATLLESTLREDDIIGRYGGEEFVLALPQTTLADAADLAEELRHQVATTIFPTAKGPVTTTISLGVAELRPDLPSFLALLDRADDALYQAKAEGRNRVVSMPAVGQ